MFSSFNGSFKFGRRRKFTVPAGVVSGDPGLALGIEASWSSDSYWDTWTSQTSGTTDLATTGGPNTANTGYGSNNLAWGLFYAHKSIRLSADATNRWGYVANNTGSNSVGLRYAVSSADNTLGSFGSEAAIATATSNSYTGGVLFQRTITTTTTIPANRYFLLGLAGGPFQKRFKSLASNRTAVSNNEAVVTTLNRFYWGGWITGPTSGIPSQLGGSATFTEVLGYVPLMSFKFVVV